MHEAQPKQSRIDIPAFGVTPTEPRNYGRNNKRHQQDELQVVLVLPPDNFALGEIADVRNTGLAAGFNNHPTDMGPEKAAVCIVRVQVGIGVTVVRTMATRPPLDGTLNCACACHRKEVLEGFRRIIRSVGPKSVVARGDAFYAREKCWRRLIATE